MILYIIIKNAILNVEQIDKCALVGTLIKIPLIVFYWSFLCNIFLILYLVEFYWLNTSLIGLSAGHYFYWCIYFKLMLTFANLQYIIAFASYRRQRHISIGGFSKIFSTFKNSLFEQPVILFHGRISSLGQVLESCHHLIKITNLRYHKWHGH